MSLEDEKLFKKQKQEAKRNWEKQLGYYEIKLSRTTNPMVGFELEEGIQNCQKNINRLDEEIQKIDKEIQRNKKVDLVEEIDQPSFLRKILVLSANPKGTSQLRLGEEIREIKEALKRSSNRDQFEVETLEAVRYRDIHRAILEYKPNIVHFSGHGAGEDGLIFEDQTGMVKLINGKALAELFELCAERVECVVLNACYSEHQAKTISQHISCVIGMSQEIQDRAAIEFVIGFYNGLGYGKSYENAYKIGCNLIAGAGIPGNLTPQFLAKDNTRSTPKTTRIISSGIENSILVPKFYALLEDYLVNKQWKEADQETLKLIMKKAKRRHISFLCTDDFKKFDCSVLRQIDHLWRQFSNDKFGFTIQRNIWKEIGGEPNKFNYRDFEEFGDCVEWRNDNGWLEYKDFTFSIDAPEGHFPTLRLLGSEQEPNWWGSWERSFKSVLSRTEFCSCSTGQRF